MSHLTMTALARLVDESPSALEAAHLQQCGECRAELERMRGDVAALAALPDVAPPAHAWHALDARLAAEGLRRHAAPRRAWLTAAARLAAGIALLAIGTATGTLLVAPMLHTTPTYVATSPDDDARHGLPDAGGAIGAGLGDDRDAAVAGVSDTAGEPDARARTADDVDTRATPVERTAGARAGARTPPVIEPVRGAVRFAAATGSDVQPRTPEEALAYMRDAESLYLDALAQFAELAGDVDGGDPVARLAALEGIVLTTGAALGQAPADPVINGYHMTALAQREATLRQIAALTAPPWF